jgi:CO/xanthine dehydrogenase FAD-binding subunit
MMQMILPTFNYHEPSNIDEACAILAELKGGASLLAGGTDLIVNMKKGLISPGNIVSMNRMEQLKEKSLDPSSGSARIGACITIAEVARSEKIKRSFSALTTGAEALGTPLIRNLATIGGNLATARPASDMAPPLMAYDARVVLTSLAGEREVPLDEFFLGPGKAVIREDEILTEILVDYQPPHSGCSYIKMGTRKTHEIGLVNVAAFLSLDNRDGSIQKARIIMGAVAPVPIRATSAEQLLQGRKPEEDLFVEAGEVAAQESRPIDDFRGSAEYRREILKVLTKRALGQAFQEVQNN